MGYAVFCSRNPCGNAVNQWYAGDEWTKVKPTHDNCISINSAFSFKEEQDKLHGASSIACKCTFEVVEIE